MKSPIEVRKLTTLIATPFVSVGRMIEQGGSLRLRNGQGSGMIRLVWKSSPPKGDALRLGNVRLPNVSGASGVETALPALSCQVWKCWVSVGPMLSRIRKTTGLVTFRASVG